MATTRTRVGLVILTEVSSLLYSGTVFGWAPMLLVLRRDGLFDSTCLDKGEATWCDEQQQLLGSIFTFAAVFYSASGISVGAFVDIYGPSKGILLAGALSICGFYLFAMSWSWAPIWVIFFGYSLIGIGGMAFFQCAFKAQYAFPEVSEDGSVAYKYQTLIIAGATTLGDASVLIWLVFELISNAYSVPLATMFGYYSIVTLVMTAALFWLWRECESEMLTSESSDEEGSEEGSEEENNYGATSTSLTTRADSTAPTSSPAVNISKLPFARQLFSREFFFLFSFACIHTTRCNLYLGLLPYFYESKQFSMGTSATSDYYVNVTSALIPLGCLCAPLINALIQTLGFGYTSQAIALIAAAQSLLMLSPSLPLQLAAACLFVVYRANVFAFPPALTGKIFGPRTVGRLTGLMFTLMSPVQFTITPALGVTLRDFNDDFRPLSALEFLSLVPLAVLTWWLMNTSRESDLGLPKKSTAEARATPRYSALPVTPTRSNSMRLQQRDGVKESSPARTQTTVEVMRTSKVNTCEV